MASRGKVRGKPRAKTLYYLHTLEVAYLTKLSSKRAYFFTGNATLIAKMDDLIAKMDDLMIAKMDDLAGNPL